MFSLSSCNWKVDGNIIETAICSAGVVKSSGAWHAQYYTLYITIFILSKQNLHYM